MAHSGAKSLVGAFLVTVISLTYSLRPEQQPRDQAAIGVGVRASFQKTKDSTALLQVRHDIQEFKDAEADAKALSQALDKVVSETSTFTGLFDAAKTASAEFFEEDGSVKRASGQALKELNAKAHQRFAPLKEQSKEIHKAIDALEALDPAVAETAKGSIKKAKCQACVVCAASDCSEQKFCEGDTLPSKDEAISFQDVQTQTNDIERSTRALTGKIHEFNNRIDSLVQYKNEHTNGKKANTIQKSALPEFQAKMATLKEIFAELKANNQKLHTLAPKIFEKVKAGIKTAASEANAAMGYGGAAADGDAVNED